ncbi:competence/damage-inducible protein A [Natranaerobius trueperi]|uniref:Putative competence-damage inducible protein n=1 Tax=Natranaerobius trueperi TaxID=759412 RepID=A0A226BVP3_9FIRM|nr:competence/damage-inducible protein A [Natranaerobius trueperi]OWZ83118.1 competence/damage-inducible protein A [Natranaerobius trueperi]
MITGEIISVGDELIEGKVLNTNASYIADQLTSIGVSVKYHQTVGDDSKALYELLKSSVSRSSVIIISGGLGPTRDDISKETLADALQLPLEFSDQEYERINSFFKCIQKPMSDNNKKQAYIPKGARILTNKIGTASGFLLTHDEKIIVMLPGPPKELKPLVYEQLIPYLKQKFPNNRNYTLSKTLKLIGIGESVVDQELSKMNLPDGVEISPLAFRHQVYLQLKTKGKDKNKMINTLNLVENEVKTHFDENLWGAENDKLEEIVTRQMKEKKITLAAAESITGGMITNKITNVSGASNVLIGGITAYSNYAKKNSLNISADVLDKFTSVSKKTSFHMSNNVRKIFRSDIGVGITGYAGPTGDQVGLIHIVITSDKESRHLKTVLPGSREDIKNGSADLALNELRCFILKTFK